MSQTLSPIPSVTTAATVDRDRAEPRSPGLADAIAAEWIKFRTLRSSGRAVALSLVAVFGIGLFGAHLAASQWHRWPSIERARFDPVLTALNGWYLGQLIIGVLGVLVITSEYGTHMVATTFSATPRRARVLASKAIVLAAAAFLLAEASCLAVFGIGQAMMTGAHQDGRRISIGVGLGDPGVARALVGAGLYVMLVALLGLAIGAIIRNSAGAIAAFLGLLFLPPILANAFPANWADTIHRYSPMDAGAQVIFLHHQPGALAPWTGLGVLALYAVVPLVAAFVLIRRRDA